jgi:hypothetical protein
VLLEMTHQPPKLPEGYRLDLASDPDAPALRRPDATVVACFIAGGVTPEAIEREALEDLLLRAGRQGEVRREGQLAEHRLLILVYSEVSSAFSPKKIG